MTKKETNLSGTLSEAVSVATSVAYTRQEIQKLKTEFVSLLEKKTTEVIVEQVPGPVGPRGALGATGAQGPKGDKGDVGERGEKGDVGQQGEIGPEGPQGIKGDKGDTGEVGPQGIAGERGPQGLKGDRGEDGKNGLDGRDGKAGEIGPIGLTGQQGIQGERGAKGDTGEKGERGERGERGENGRQGIQGSVGPRGEIGPQGIQGIAGKDGKDGDIKPVEEKFQKFIENVQKDVNSFKTKVNAAILKSGPNDAWKATGSGEVNLRYLDDIDRDSITDGYVLSYDSANAKFKFVEQGGGDGTDQWARDQANAAYNYANTLALESGTLDTTARTTANSAWYTANLAYVTANSAWATANSALNQQSGDIDPFARSQANSAFNQANLSYIVANNSWSTANASYIQANTGTALAQAAYDYANTLITGENAGTDNLARSIANSAFATANAAYNTANSAWTTANTQSDWNVSDNTSVAFIKNKPTLVTTLNDLSDATIVSPLNEQVLVYNTATGQWINQAIGISANNLTTGYFGGFFYNGANVALSNTSLAYTVPISSSYDGTNGVTIGGNNDILIAYAGTYHVEYSIQFENNGNSEDAIDIWVRVNGVNVANSASKFSIHKKNGNDPGFLIAVTPYLLTCNAADRIQFEVSSSTGQTKIASYPTQINPTTPAIPAVIANVQQVSSIVIPNDITGTANNANYLGGRAANTYATTATTNTIATNVASAWSTANSALSIAQSAFAQANTGGAAGTDNVARSIANSAFSTANSAFAKANTGTSQLVNGASTVSLSADGNLTLAGPISGLGNAKLDFTTYGANAAYLTTTSDDTTALYMGSVSAELYAHTNVQIRANTGGVSQNWTFNEDGTLTFPDSTVQTTAATNIDALARSIANSAFDKANTSVTYNQSLNTSNTVSFAGVTVTGNTTVQHVIPSANVTYDLGTPTARFRDLYLSGNTINLGGAQLSANGSTINLPAQTKVGNKNLTFEEISTIAIDTEIASSDGGLNINKLTRYRDLQLSSFSGNTINSLSTTAFNTVYSISQERFNTTMVCDNEDDIIITLPSSNTISVGFNITVNRLNTGDITVETSPDADNDIIRYGGWKFEKLKLLYMKDRQLSEFETAKFSSIPSLNGIYPSANDFVEKYTFKYTYIGNSTYMLSA